MFINIILGPQGAGKDTQAKLLEEQGYVKAFSAGDILREVATTDDKIARILQAGDLVDTKTLTQILVTFFNQHNNFDKNTNHIILTGFPREYEQIAILNTLIKSFNWQFGLAIVLDLSLNDIQVRLENRYVCPKCGAIYNLLTNPPKIPGHCDYDGAKLVKRADDTDINVIKRRLKVYQEKTLPLIKYFDSCGCIYKTTADRPIQEINKELQLVFKNFDAYHSKCKYPARCK